MLDRQLQPLANRIDELPVTSIGGLKAKALVAFWHASPLCAGDHEVYFQDEAAFQRLFIAVAEFCGLAGSVRATGYAMPEWPNVEQQDEEDEAV
ncbi:hypothetical protein ABIF38_003533 [Bradyrhizobium japonicum]|uniref:Uncharacterized protein n=1 Tax=Bradyrhizobium elkanii TaxID=29448 RepID=A0ABV4FBD2_BRAEL|nr:MULTISPECIES: hypothetical protein [Bradyrhizobium]MBP2432530.1 hypothetical protein [Bradyrhizobium elkanii]MCP1734154.1 hypothetical protein [Bradyrhizobium elkanii]MCP1751836.1 hypothetical protein [Bradyrhizobium elkanii]MCP1966876.1 hypothetical protein [Bradyrhizobium elkanii]MCP1977607.1 hypothetical protein [Bradyrhizobium elkanii]